MQTCLRCKVQIHGDTVHFSYGKPGSRARLDARVCQHVRKRDLDGCINDFTGSFTADDNYGDGRELHAAKSVS